MTCTICKYYKKEIQGSIIIIVCTGEGIDRENCIRTNNYRPK